MRLLWVVNVPTPEALGLWELDPSSAGGWISEAARGVEVDPRVAQFSVAFPFADGGQHRRGSSTTTYHTVASRRVGTRLSHRQRAAYSQVKRILDDEKPDLVHLWGTELLHALPTVAACREARIPVVVSIQGLLNGIAPAFLRGLPQHVKRARYWADPIIPVSPRAQKAAIASLANDERSCLRACDLLLGRTSWDEALARLLGSDTPYHHCDEVLRKPFREGNWSIDGAESGRLLLPQGSVSFKGMHILLDGLRHLRRTHADAHLVVAGQNPLTSRGPYPAYLRQLIRKWDLQNSVHCTGNQDSSEMAELMLGSRVFVLPSFIENSPNSLAEAMSLGAPTVSSFVGGIPDMVRHGINGLLVEPGSPAMLSAAVGRLLTDDPLSTEIGRNAQVTARGRHDPLRNTEELFHAYSRVV